MTDQLRLLIADPKNNPVGMFDFSKDQLGKITNMDLMKKVMKTDFMSKLPRFEGLIVSNLEKHGFSDVNRMRLNAVHGTPARALVEKKQTLAAFLTKSGHVPKDFIMLTMKDLGA